MTFNEEAAANPSEYAALLQQVRDGFAALKTLNQRGDLSEVTADIRDTHLEEIIMAQLMMEILPADGMSPTDKMYWIVVANHMGPDYIQALRTAGAFMAAADKF